MSRNGAVEQNVSRGTDKNISSRIAEITFEKKTAPGRDVEFGRGAKEATEKQRKESRKVAVEQGASDKKISMKQRLLERQRQVAQQAPSKEAKPKHQVQEL